MTTTQVEQYHQPAAEIPDGIFYTQQVGGNEKWAERTRAELLADLASATPPAFRTVLACTELDADGKPARLSGPFYADFDGDLDETCTQFKRFLGKLQAHGVALEQCRMYATGGRGFHVEIPAACLTAQPDAVGLHLTYRELAMSLFVDSLDLRVFSSKRMWRTPGVQRENGCYKVPLSVAEALSITPESYADLCRCPRPHPALEAPTLAPKLAAVFAMAQDKVFKSQARRKQTSLAAAEFKRLTGGTIPPTIEGLMQGRARLKDGVGWNQIALQVALVAHAQGLSEAALIDGSRGLIAAHRGDSGRYGTPEKRAQELRNQYRYTADNPAYEVSVPAVLALLDKNEPADDLRDLVADVPDNGFSVLDLMTGHGRSRRLRSDLEALLQLLCRDPRLEGLVCFDEFAGAPQALRSWREAMQMDGAPSAPGEVEDAHILAAQLWLAREWKLDVGKDRAASALLAWARADSFNPVTRRLSALAKAWDGEPRLDSWLIDYAHAVTDDDGEDFTPYVRAVGTKWLISAVARAFRPGCQADVALVLTGAQGYRKSSIVRTLAEALVPSVFADGFSLDGAGKTPLEKLRGKLIVEWAEMTGLTRRDVKEVKNFLTQRDDAYRAPYDRLVKKYPRTCIIAGTSNETELFSDATGHRRFWTVGVGERIQKEDLQRLREMGPQIWGEAAHRFMQGEPWWIDPDDEAELHGMERGRQVAAQVSTRYDELAVRLAEAVLLGEAELHRLVDRVGPAEWYSVLDMQRMLTCLNGDRHFSDLEWAQMVTALKRQGWAQALKKKARTRHYQVGPALLERVSECS